MLMTYRRFTIAFRKFPEHKHFEGKRKNTKWLSLVTNTEKYPCPLVYFDQCGYSEAIDQCIRK